MKSKVVTPWDYTQFVLPDRFARWRVTDEELQHRLSALAKKHSVESDAETAEMGDSISCKSESLNERWKWKRPHTSLGGRSRPQFLERFALAGARENLLLYPSKGLIDPILENACIGAKAGDTVMVSLPEGDLKLTVQRIVRRIPVDISDDLICLENIEGVSTIEDYKSRYRKTTQQERYERGYLKGSYLLQTTMLENSVLSIDEEEQAQFCHELAEKQFQLMGGMDNFSLVMMDEDVLNPSEAGVKKKMEELYQKEFPMHVLGTWITENLTGRDMADVQRDGSQSLMERYDAIKTIEDVLPVAGQALLDFFSISIAAANYLEDYTKKLMEV